jgi:cytosine/adenosine deaminase-related metal-dependent hydrolase
MDLGESDGGLPPDSLVEPIDEVLAETERLAGLQDADGLVQLAVAPCSPFSVTKELMVESAALARRLGLRLHTHLAETVEEDAYCRELFGCRPVEYLSELGWVAGDVWCAHCVHLSADDVGEFGRVGVGVAHCPTSNLRLGAGVAPVRDLLDAGAPVGLGVDGSASNERSDLFFEVKQALLVARGRGGPRALTVRDALRLGTRGGAAVLGRDDIGQLAPGKRADIAVWRTDGLELGGAEPDPVAGLVLSAPHRVDRLYVGGEEVVRDGHLVRADEAEIAREHRVQSKRLS